MAQGLGVYRVEQDSGIAAHGEPLGTPNIGVELVGNLDLDKGHARGSFAYAASYLNSPLAAPISFSLPLREKPFGPEEARPYFEGLLPEGRPREAVAASLQVRADDWVSILEGYGFECVGDIAVARAENDAAPSYEPIDIGDLGSRLAKSAAAASELNRGSRLSLAGTQGKVGLAHMPGQSLSEGWLRPKGMAGSTHILKSSWRNEILYLEFLCMRAAETCGVRAARTDLLDLDGPIVCSERYDRAATLADGALRVARRHQEDMAQAFGIASASKYAELDGGTARSIADFLLETTDNPIRNIDAFARMALFNYLVGNCDNHLKNVSLLYSEDWLGTELAPAYDIVCTTWFPDLSRTMGMVLGGATEIDEVEAGHIEKFAQEIGMAPVKLRGICRELARNVAPAIRKAADEAPDTLDEVFWKADDLIEDIEPRRRVLEAV